MLPPTGTGIRCRAAALDDGDSGGGVLRTRVLGDVRGAEPVARSVVGADVAVLVGAVAVPDGTGAVTDGFGWLDFFVLAEHAASSARAATAAINKRTVRTKYSSSGPAR